MVVLAISDFAVNPQGAADLERRPLPLQAFRQSTVWNSNFEMSGEEPQRDSATLWPPLASRVQD